jgi:hypothetical protein
MGLVLGINVKHVHEIFVVEGASVILCCLEGAICCRVSLKYGTRMPQIKQ